VDFIKKSTFFGDLFENQPGYRTSPLIAGPSGSGKSTLAHCINELIPHAAFSVSNPAKPGLPSVFSLKSLSEFILPQENKIKHGKTERQKEFWVSLFSPFLYLADPFTKRDKHNSEGIHG
jgi:energy-coupling factor transporter ATP-binding protein EcfA2